jgi:DNA helicase HerA-like ATPase
VIKLAENLTLDYSDFRYEGLRVAVFARSGSGKSNLAALFAEQALEQGHQTLVIEFLGEYNTLKEYAMSCGLLRVETFRWLLPTRGPMA